MRGSFVRSEPLKVIDEAALMNWREDEVSVEWRYLGDISAVWCSGCWRQMPALSLNRFNYTSPHQLNDVEMSLMDVTGVIELELEEWSQGHWMKMNSLTSAVSFHHVFELLNRKNYQMDWSPDYCSSFCGLSIVHPKIKWGKKANESYFWTNKIFFLHWLFLWLKKVSILQFKIKTFSTHTLNLNVCLKFCLSSFMRTLSRSMSLSGRASVCYINDRGFEEKIYSVSKYHNDHTFTWPRETTTGYSNKTKNTESEQVQKFTIQMYNCYSKWTETKPDWEKQTETPVWNVSEKLFPLSRTRS